MGRQLEIPGLEFAVEPELMTIKVAAILPVDPTAKSATTGSIERLGFHSTPKFRRLSEDEIARYATARLKTGDVVPEDSPVWSFELIDGERRIKDARTSGIEEVPALVYPHDVPRVFVSLLRSMSNLARSEKIVAEAREFGRLLEEGWTDQAIASTFKIPITKVKQRLRIHSLGQSVLDQIAAGNIAPTTASKVANLPAYQRTEVLERLARGDRITGRVLKQIQEARHTSELANAIEPDIFENLVPPVLDLERELRVAVRAWLEIGHSRRSVRAIADEIGAAL